MMHCSVKVCRVCGDKALGFNFNGLSCESCKAFFRRNAIKNKKVICKKENNCLIEKSTRKFCKRCRIDKCYAIGMKKELIMILNKNATLPKIPKIINDYNQGLMPYDLFRIVEIEKAVRHFPCEHKLPLVGHSDDVLYLANLTEHYGRRAIKFCKSIKSFQSLQSEDQLQMFKSFYPELTAIQMSFIYVEEKDGILLANETEQEVIFAKLETSNSIKGVKDYAKTFRRFAFALRVIMDNDATIRNLIFAQLLFKPRDDTACPEFIKYNYSVYTHLTRKFSGKGDRKFVSLMTVLGQVGETSQLYKKFYRQEFSPCELNEIVRELYDIQM